MNSPSWKSFFSQLFLFPPFHPVYVIGKKKKSHLVTRSRNSPPPKARILRKKVWQFHKICSGLFRVKHKVLRCGWLSKARNEKLDQIGKMEKRHYIFLLQHMDFSLVYVRENRGREGPSDCSCLHSPPPPIILLPPHLVPRDTLTS